MRYTSINVAHSDFINKFMRAINTASLIKKVRVKVNSKLWFDSEIISAIQKRDKVYSRYKKSGLETDKDKFETSKIFV